MQWTIPIPGHEIPESRIFAHSTRMADAWTAWPERIVAPALRVEPTEMIVTLADGNTADLGYRRPTRNPIRRIKRCQTLDMSGRFVYDARYQTDNMGHYVADTVAKILTARRRLSQELGEEVVIHSILREGAVPMTVQIFEALGLPAIPTEANVVGRIVTVTGKVPITRAGDAIAPGECPMATAILPDLYTDFREQLLAGPPTPEKIFLSRKSCRTIENEQEIADLLAPRGFRKVYFENDELPVLEQWRIIARAREIVAIHGAGLTSIVFNKHGLDRPPGDLTGLRVIELYGAGYFVDFNRRLAAVMNAHWCGVRGQITPVVVRDMDFRGGGRIHQASSFRIDPRSLELALDESAIGCSEAMV